MAEHVFNVGFSRIFAFGNAAHHNVPVGDDADQIIVLVDHGDRANILNFHDGSDFFQAAVHLDGFHLSGHNLADLHSTPLSGWIRIMMGLIRLVRKPNAGVCCPARDENPGLREQAAAGESHR